MARIHKDGASRPAMIRAAAGSALFLMVPGAAFAKAPLSYMSGAGARNYPVVALLWGLIIISLVVVVVVTVLLLIGLFRTRPEPASGDPKLVPPRRSEGGLQWIYVGTAISAFVLFGSALWTFAVLGAVVLPSTRAPFRIEVIGHQWWWEVHYLAGQASRNFTTANEIHIPIGQPVPVVVSSVDVIHSFWVPALSGKTDTIPGQHNETWLEADHPGVYRGQCTEYCGQQHAHMGLSVIAQRPAEFQAWWDEQLSNPPLPSSQQVVAGEDKFVAHCGICHAVRGTRADGRLGPDLSHLLTRGGIASDTLPNTPGHLSGWISDPQAIKPGNLMPTLTLSARDLSDIRSYLETLQ
jgi:cytochrome c oxidase subunit II